MNFLSHQGHDPFITQVATPLLKLLSTVDNLEIFEELDSEIQEILRTIDPDFSDFLRSNALESLELLKNFALIDNAFDLILKNNALQSVLKLLTSEISQDEASLIEKGELSTNDRLITASIGFINTLLMSPKAIISKENLNQIQENLLKIVKSHNNTTNQLKESIKGLQNLLKSKENQEYLLDECINQGLLDALIENLDRYKENTEISQEINALLLDFTRLSKEIASILSEKDFLKILLKETRVLFKSFINYPKQDILDRLRENLICLKVFALLGELPAKKLYQGGGFELCSLMIQKSLERKEEDFNNINNNKDFSREIRLFTLENREEALYISSLLPEILGFCGVLRGVKEGNEGDIDFALNLLKVLKGFFRNRNVVLMIMEMMEVIWTSEIKENIEKINVLEIFWTVLNYHPLDERVEISIGEILFKMKPQIFDENLIEIDIENDNKKDFPLDLANFMTIYASKLRKPQLSEANLAKIQDILVYYEKNMPENYNLRASIYLLLSKLSVYIGNDIKTFLLKSSIPNLIIESLSSIPKEIIMFLEISLHALNQILTFPIKSSAKIDPFTFDYEENKPSYVLTEALSDLYVSNQGQHLTELVSFAENKDEGFLSINHKALELLFNCAYLHPALAAFLNENYGLNKMQDLYEDICKRSRDINENSLVMKLCKLIAAMSRIQICFDDILKKTNFLQILLNSIQGIEFFPGISQENCGFLEEFIWCLGTFGDNNFDKAELLEKKVIEFLMEKMNVLNKIGFEVIYKREFIGEVFIQVLKTIKILEKDPSILRIICSDYEMKRTFEEILHKMTCEKNKENQNNVFEGVLEEFKIDFVVSSEKMQEKIIENMLNLFVEMTKNPLVLENFDINKSALFYDLMDLIQENKHNLIIVVRALKVLENSMRSICEKGLFKLFAEDEQKMKKIEEFISIYKVVFH